MFGHEVSLEAQAIIAQLPQTFAADGRRVLLHPLPFYNNSIGAHDMGMMSGAMTPSEMLDGSGEAIRAMYVVGSFLPQHLEDREDALAKLDFLVVLVIAVVLGVDRTRQILGGVERRVDDALAVEIDCHVEISAAQPLIERSGR